MRITILILLTCLVVSCNDPKNDGSDSNILVTIGSENITTDDLTSELNKLSFKQKSIYTSSPEKLNGFLQTHINEKVLYNEAVKRGIENREDIQEDIESYKKKLVTKTLGKEIFEEIELNQEEIKEYYDKNQEDYKRIDISKIFIRFDVNEEDAKASALSKAELVSKRANAGESFEELAIESSDDPISKKRGGKVGYINKGRFPEEIDKEIFILKKGEITNPFEVQGGYLIIKSNKEPDYPPYAQVERMIRSELINQRLLDYINGLRGEWEVTVYKDRLKEISESESNQK
ncbi:MAG: peptidylprolyl isomerase [Candidatus Dadabacteria bacterium]|jgi:peptidyl-prolyl cis-trans isomerase C